MTIGEITKIVSEYCQRTGASIPEVAKVLGLHSSTLYEWLRKDPDVKITRKYVPRFSNLAKIG